MCEFHKYIKCPLDYLQEGFLVQEICEKMNISRKTIIQQYKEDFIVFIKKLIAKGFKYNHIESITGIDSHQVSKLAAEDEKNYLLTQEKISLIVELNKSGMTPGMVAKEIGVTVYHVHDALKTEMIIRYLKMTSIKQLKIDLRMDNTKIAKVIKDAGINVVPGHGAYNHFGNGAFPFFKPISSYLEDIIVGELLGDGHIKEIKHESGKYSFDGPSIGLDEYKKVLDTLKELYDAHTIENMNVAIEKFNKSVKALQNAKATHFELGLKLSSSDWVRFDGEKFKEGGYRISYYRAKTNDNDGFYREDSFNLRTENSAQLQKFRESWYQKLVNGKNIKILPENYGGLNENRILHWYTGDGSYSGGEVSFAADGFREQLVGRVS